MKIIATLIATTLLAACATVDEQEDRREETAIADFIEVSELRSVSAIRTLGKLGQISSREVSDLYVIVSAGRDEFLLEYFTPCRERSEGGVEWDYRKDPRALYAKASTYRGCRIKAIYALQRGQADEIRSLGGSVGGWQ